MYPPLPVAVDAFRPRCGLETRFRQSTELRSEVGQPNPKGILTLLRKRVFLTMLRIATSDFFFELHTRKHFKKRVFSEVHVNVKEKNVDDGFFIFF